MDTSAIRTLKPNVTQKEAVRAFSASGFAALYWRMRIGPLQKIADAYVPFWLYRVRYQLGRTPHARLFAPRKFCARRCCALFSSKDSSSFAKPGWRLRGRRAKCIFPIGLVFMVAAGRYAAACWTQ